MRKIHKNKRKLFGFEKGEFIYLNDFGKNPCNTYLECSTRGGKTTQQAFPMIDIVSRMNNYLKRPTLFMSDPKGELFDNMAETLRARGYEVISINTKEELFTNTHCFNPLRKVYDIYKKHFDYIKPYLDNFDLIKKQANPLKEYYRQLALLPDEVKNNYSFDPAIKMLEQLSLTFINSDSPDATFWDGNAQKWFNGLLYYMLEISVLDDDPNKFNLFALNTYLNSDAFSPKEKTYKIDGSKFTEEISDYEIVLKSLPLDHYSVKNLPKGVKSEQQGNFKAIVLSSLKVFDGGARKITSLNNIDLNTILEGDKPYAVFLITPDYETLYNPIISCVVEQVYALFAKGADENHTHKLNRNVIFLLDEFKQIPKIQNIGAKVSVCLGRGICFYFILQNLDQLIDQYGAEEAATIIGNCNHQIYLKASRIEDAERISNEIGSTTRLIEFDEVGSGNKLDWRPEKQPLIRPEEIQKLNMPNSIQKIIGMDPLSTTLLPSFKYQGKFKKTTPQEFYKNVDKPHLKTDNTDLFYQRVLNPFNDLHLYEGSTPEEIGKDTREGAQV